MQRLTIRHRAGTFAVAAGLMLAGCGSSVGISPAGSTKSAKSGGSGAMAGMNMGSGSSAAVPEVNGVRPVASQVLATAYWQGMKVQARTMTPVSFVVFRGNGKEQMIHPPKGTSFHLMVMLNDQHTGVAIPYAGVWATILNAAGKVVYDDQQWPMISAYMGPHYGNNVSLPGAGRYTLKLLISPPVAARHLEYAHVWQHQHTIVEHFTWKPPV